MCAGGPQFLRTEGKVREQKSKMAALSDSSTDDDLYPLVICPGRHFLSAGFGGDDAPRAVFPPVVGRPRHRGVMVGMWQRDSYVGDEATAKRGILDLKTPLTHSDGYSDGGVIDDFDDFEKVLHHTFFNELRVAPEEHPVMLSEPCMNPTETREKTVQVLFETFNPPACFLEMAPRLALFASGRTQGLVADMGHGPVRCAAFSETRPVEGVGANNLYPELMAPPSLSAVGGAMVDDELIFRLGQSGTASLTTTAEREIARDIKEKNCRVTPSGGRGGGAGADSTQYEMPDGTVIECSEDHLSSPDILFDPSLRRCDNPGDAQLGGLGLADAIANAAAADPVMLYQNVVLCGGSSMFDNLGERLTDELRPRHGGDVKVVVPPERKYSIWIGGSILVSLSSMGKMWVSKQDYDEVGPAIITQRWPGGDALFKSGSLTKPARA
jgi:Actin